MKKLFSAWVLKGWIGMLGLIIIGILIGFLEIITRSFIEDLSDKWFINWPETLHNIYIYVMGIGIYYFVFMLVLSLFVIIINEIKIK